jgi:hypothetical protein
LSLQGPSFRYFSKPGAQGSDPFTLAITGISLPLKGESMSKAAVNAH